jgi:trehalose 6-phosphate phosphatase
VGPALAALHDRTGGALALVSGRPLRELDALLPAAGWAAAGQHGLEWRAPDGSLHRPPPPAALEPAREALADLVARHPALLLEDKGLSLALHYRRAPRLAGFAHRAVRQLATQLGPELVVQTGKRVIELRPAGQDKGAAVRRFLALPPFRGRRPVFLGDDVTDEAAFGAVNALGGHSIKVGRGPTAARWRLAGVDDVRAWLAGDAAPLRPASSPDRRTA